MDAAPQSYPEFIKSMLAPLRHRGPDEVGYFIDDGAALGNTRLSIIDVASGHQPMGTEDDRYWLTFNGEIFNYLELRQELEGRCTRFRTQSDTEVLLRALVTWGEDALPKLEGQFAFLFLDRRERRLLFARDRFGERPLFYTASRGGFAFASEIKALFGLPWVPRRLSASGVAQAAQFWVTLPGETCFEGVSALRPGHVGVVADGRMTVRQYSRPPLGIIRAMTRQDAQELAVATLKESTRLRLRSDVPVGVYVSGGLDSTITTALALEVGIGRPTSFSVSFTDPAFDEQDHQALVARHFGIDNVSVRVAEEDIGTHFPMAVWHAETVLVRTAPVPMLLLARAVRERGIKVVLTGEGADETFLGYEIFRETLFRREFASLDEPTRLERLRQLYPYLDAYCGDDARMLLAFYAANLGERVPGLFSHEPRFAGGAYFARLLNEPVPAAAHNQRLADMMAATHPGFTDLSPLAKAQALEYDTLLSGYLLSSQGDRMASAHGVEGRYPFLDTRVVAAGLSMPEPYRLRDGVHEKQILVEAFASRLPPGISSRRKQPYRAPGVRSFRGARAAERVASLLHPNRVRDIGLFHEERLTQFVARVGQAGVTLSPRDEMTFVALLSTAELHEAFVKELPRPEFPEHLVTVAIDRRSASLAQGAP